MLLASSLPNAPGAGSKRQARPAFRAGVALGATNTALASTLRECADLLEEQQANQFRIRAYRRAADIVESLKRPVPALLREGGREALIALPAIGSRIASALAEMIGTGHWQELDRLRGATNPEVLFRSIPGIGAKLATRIVDELHVDTLEGLEQVAYDGRLALLKGIGARRLQAIRVQLAERLGGRRIALSSILPRPSVAVLFDVDAEYRELAKLGRLPVIAPRRFNPDRRAWLPILHTRRGKWRLTALFSNSARANDLGRIGDWVIISYHAADNPGGQCTIVTERSGPAAGQRVVRGREDESLVFRAKAARKRSARHAS